MASVTDPMWTSLRSPLGAKALVDLIPLSTEAHPVKRSGVTALCPRFRAKFPCHWPVVQYICERSAQDLIGSRGF